MDIFSKDISLIKVWLKTKFGLFPLPKLIGKSFPSNIIWRIYKVFSDNILPLKLLKLNTNFKGLENFWLVFICIPYLFNEYISGI